MPSNDDAFSKRTVICAQFAYADADLTPTLRTGVILNGAYPDAKTSVFGVDIGHDF